MWIRIVWRICGDLRSTFASFQVSRGRSDLDGSSTYFLLIFGRRPDFLDHSLAWHLKPKADGNRKVLDTATSWFFFVDAVLNPLDLGLPVLPRLISNGTWDLWSFCAQAWEVPCAGASGSSVGNLEMLKPLETILLSSAFLLAVYVGISSRAPKWWVSLFFWRIKAANGQTVLCSYLGMGPNLPNINMNGWWTYVEEAQPRVQNFDISCNIM